MGWRWRLGEWFGIVVYMHVTFLLLLGWVALVAFKQGQGAGGALSAILYILLVFACVVAHEYGHALTARRYGIQTRDITLLPIGGVARLERMPRDPVQELWVALAGPAVNVVIAIALFLLLTLGRDISSAYALQGMTDGFLSGNMLTELLRVNLLMIGFNLLPAFPMDGGRVLRAILAQRLEYARATRVAANVGQMMAFLFGFLGLVYGMPMLLFIALFVYMGAEAEAQAVQVQTTFRGVTVRQAMMTRIAALSVADSLGRAVELLLSSSQQDFPVITDARVAGLLPRRELLAALQTDGPASAVGDAMRTDIVPVEATAPLDDTFQRMQTDNLSAIPVVETGRLVGLITLENIAEFLMVTTALDHGPKGGSDRNVRQVARTGFEPVSPP